MKEHNTTIEQALSMYKETVSPSEKSLQVLLSQIPEQQQLEKRRVIRSPYTWLAVTQVVMLCSFMLVMFSTLSQPAYHNDPFYKVDKQIDEFEAATNQEDYEQSLLDYVQ